MSVVLLEHSGMMGERTIRQSSLFYGFSLEDHVPSDHLLRSIDRFVELSDIRRQLAPYYSAMGRPSIDSELMIRMLLIGYCCGIRSERRLCQEVSLNLACRWFCRLDLIDPVPDHSTFSKNRHGRFRDSDLLRKLFEANVRRCMGEDIVGGEGVAVDASTIRADAHRQRGVATPAELDHGCPTRAVSEYLAVLDDAAFGAATEVAPKFISPVDPAAREIAAAIGPACYACCDNYLIGLKCAVIVDIEPTTAIRQAEVTAAKTMIARTAETFGLESARLAADTGYGSAEMLAWLVGAKPCRHTVRLGWLKPSHTTPPQPYQTRALREVHADDLGSLRQRCAVACVSEGRKLGRTKRKPRLCSPGTLTAGEDGHAPRGDTRNEEVHRLPRAMATLEARQSGWGFHRSLTWPERQPKAARRTSGP